jgi:hypothetical protein
MRVYTYSEARQKLSSILDKAESMGKVIIRRKDGRTFALIPEQTRSSPLDVPSIKTTVSTEELVEILRKERGRTRGRRRRNETRGRR